MISRTDFLCNVSCETLHRKKVSFKKIEQQTKYIIFYK